MSERDAILHIQVVDENGKPRKPGKNDKVEINHRDRRDRRDMALPWDESVGFFYSPIGKGEIVLSIEYDGFARLLQWFQYESPADKPVFKPFWPGTNADPSKEKKKRRYLLECMQISRATGGHDKKRSREVISITVTLKPTREHIAVIGADYYEGIDTRHPKRKNLDFDRYAITFNKHLWESRDINFSSPFTMLRCDTGRHITYMRAKGNGWRPQTSVEIADPALWDRPSKYRKWLADLERTPSRAGNYLGAVAVYKFLSDIGRQRPGTVVDFGVYSHAYHGGPILFNTIDDAKASAERYEGDLDMRFTKDFIAPNKDKWKRMPDALHKDGVVRIWGCFNTDLFDAMVKQLIRSKPKWPFKHADLSGELDRAGVVKRLNDTVDGASYMKKIAKFVDRPAWGGLPGFGSEHVPYDDLKDISADLRKKINGSVMHVVVIARPGKYGSFYKKMRPLFETAELGARKFNAFGYMKYVP